MRESRSASLLPALVAAGPVIVGVLYAAAGALGAAGPGATGLTTERLRRVLAEPALWRSLGWTLGTATAATLLATAVAVTLATAFRGPQTGDRVAQTLAVLPLPIPHIVAAASAILLLGQSGLLARLAFALGLVRQPSDMPALVFDRWGLGFILTLAWKELPFLSLVSFSVLATRGLGLEETARTLGAGRWTTLRRVTMPLLARGLLPAMIAVFVFVAGSYEASALLAASDPLPLPVLTLERYSSPDLARRGDAYVLTLVGLLLGAALVALYEWARARWEPLDT